MTKTKQITIRVTPADLEQIREIKLYAKDHKEVFNMSEIVRNELRFKLSQLKNVA